MYADITELEHYDPTAVDKKYAASRFDRAKKGLITDLPKEELKGLSLKPNTRDVIAGVKGVLGYTELHPEVVDQIFNNKEKLEKFENTMKDFDNIIQAIKGFNMKDVR